MNAEMDLDPEVNVKFVVNSRSKRIGMKVSELGDVIVNLPKARDLTAAKKFVMSNQKWILNNVLKIKKRVNEHELKFDLKFEDGAQIILFNEPTYSLKIQQGKLNKFKVDDVNDILQLTVVDDSQIKSLLVKFYREIARKFFEERSKYFADKLGVEFNKVYIKDQSTRWGSCSSDKNLNFNFRVVLAPERVLDYLVIHEVAHLKYMDHSKNFWAVVASLMPDYKIQANWLKQHGFILKHFLR